MVFPDAKAPNTATMMRAAPVINPAVERNPCATASALSGLIVALADPAQQEYMVVHRKTEDDGEQEQRDPHVDHCGVLKP